MCPLSSWRSKLQHSWLARRRTVQVEKTSEWTPDRAAALALARAGADLPAALKFIRKAAGLKAVELSALLGLTPQHLSRIENGKAAADKRTVALVAALLEDRVAGTTRTADQLRAIDRPRKLKGTVHLGGGAGLAR